jgi:hypothetical protein
MKELIKSLSWYDNYRYMTRERPDITPKKPLALIIVFVFNAVIQLIVSALLSIWFAYDVSNNSIIIDVTFGEVYWIFTLVLSIFCIGWGLILTGMVELGIYINRKLRK